MQPSLPSFLTKLTLDALADWAGKSVFQRGVAYHKNGRVRDSAQTSEGGLLATVDGTRKYATLLFQKPRGKLVSTCTCPYGPRCKHAVALACVGLSLLAEKKSLPLADRHDMRLLDLEIATSPDEDSTQLSPAALQKLASSLQKRSQEELVALILNAVRLAPEVANLCAAGDETSPKDGLTLLKDVRKAMRKALAVSDEWEEYRHPSPDYEPVRKKLELLRLAGFAKEVLDIGLELLEDLEHQIETIGDDNGDIHDDIAQCMPIILQALYDVDWPLHKKLLWAVDAILADDFYLCDAFWRILRETHPPEAWNPVADALAHRTEQYKKDLYSRRPLIDMAAHVFTAAGREADLCVLYAREAVGFGDYLRLVQHLLKKGEDREAEKWIHKGLAATDRKEPYTERQLRSCLLDLRIQQKDWDAVLCLQVEDFVRQASLNIFTECRSSAEKLKVWPVLQPLLMDFLIERTLPWKQAAWPCRNQGKAASSRDEKHPDFGILIDLAIHAKNQADVLKWYDLQCTTQRGYRCSANAHKVATAVQDFAPERSLALWKNLAEAQIALVNPRAYVEAAVFLRKMRTLIDKLSMTAQWNAYMQSLRTEHRRKIRLMEVLDTLTLDSKQPTQGVA